MAEAKFWSASKLNDSRRGSKEFWNVVKLLTGKSVKSRPIGPIMYVQKELVVEDSTTAAPLTFSFQQLGKNLSNVSHPGRLTLILLFYRITPEIGDLVLSDNAFKDKFKLIKRNKAHGADNLSAGEMKLVFTKEFSPCVANLSRQRYAAGFIPRNGKSVWLMFSGKVAAKTIVLTTGH